jgi:MtaA/CmuA family methyltransferase
MTKYSAMDRFRDALNGKPRDRVPLIPMVSAWAAANFAKLSMAEVSRRPDLIADAHIRAREQTGYDAMFSYADSLYIAEAHGCKVRYPKTGPIADPLTVTMTCNEDVYQLPVPDVNSSGRIPQILEVVQRLSDYGKGDLPVLGTFEGAFTSLCRVVEPDRILKLVLKNPFLLEKLLDRVNEFLLRFGRALIEHGANVIFIPEPTGSASMISPATFQRFVLPRLQALTAQLDAPCILHICGDTSPILELMGQSGADVVSLDQCMNLASARAALPGLTLGGNVDPIDAFLMGTKEKVVEATRHCLNTAGTSRFVLMSGCGVPPGTSVENMAAFVKTAGEYGV